MASRHTQQQQQARDASNASRVMVRIFPVLFLLLFFYIDCMYAYHHHHRHLQVNTQLGLYRPYQPYTKCCQCLVMYCY